MGCLLTPAILTKGAKRSMSLVELLWLTFLIFSALFCRRLPCSPTIIETGGWWIGVPAGAFLWVSITVGLLKMSRLYDRLFPIRPFVARKSALRRIIRSWRLQRRESCLAAAAETPT